MPLESCSEEREFDLKTLISHTYSKIKPMGLSLRSYSECSPNEHGVITIGTGDSDTAPFEDSYTVVYRKGMIEAVRAGLILPNQQSNAVTFLRYEESVLQYVRECFQILSSLGCSPPILVGITLFGVGVRNCSTRRSVRDTEFQTISKRHNLVAIRLIRQSQKT